MIFFTEIEKTHKIYMEVQKALNYHNNPEQKEQCWRYHNNQLQIILQSLVAKTAWYWHETDM
jgi:hypothetical protein